MVPLFCLLPLPGVCFGIGVGIAALEAGTGRAVAALGLAIAAPGAIGSYPNI